MVTKETVNTIETGELLQHVEQEATVVTCRRPLIMRNLESRI